MLALCALLAGTAALSPAAVSLRNSPRLAPRTSTTSMVAIAPALGQALAPAIGSAMVVGSAAKSVPQILRIVQHRSVQGLSPASLYGDALVYATKVAYHMRKQHPFSSWGELLCLMGQNIVSVGLLHRFGEGSVRQRQRRAVADAVGLTAVWALFALLPTRLLPLLPMSTAPLLLCSYGAQIATNMRRGSTGELATLSVFLRWAGSLARVLTTMMLLNGDAAVLAGHALGVLGCTILLAQLYWYNRAGYVPKPRPATVPSEPAPARPLSAAEAAMEAAGAALMWQSLGGFGGGSNSEESLLRRFKRIDLDGDGTIRVSELQKEVKLRSLSVSPETVQRMVELADVNGDGAIDFAEFKHIMQAAYPQGHLIKYRERWVSELEI